ncbi:hypothetical protein Tco_1043778 [Tanacetum coccineum]|uniref:Uncharacterized protein n=1 Tax=Tanacetum coccineum TaxID=301880 RepID=A0ABQ5GN19_9ASTR
MCVFDFISKCCLRKAFTRSPIQYKEYLSEFWYTTTALENSKVYFSIPSGGMHGVLGVNTFRKAIGANYLAKSSDYADPPSIEIVRPWFAIIRYGKDVPAKDYAMIFWEDLLNKLKEKTKEKDIPYIRFISLLLMQRLQDSYNDDNLTIYPTQTFSANNLALKANQPEGPPFTAHMLAIDTGMHKED